MNKIKCRCGKSEMTFKYLTLKDLPKGYESGCCPAKEEVSLKEAPKTDPEAASQEPSTEAPPIAPVPAEAPKRGPGRPRKNQNQE